MSSPHHQHLIICTSSFTCHHLTSSATNHHLHVMICTSSSDAIICTPSCIAQTPHTIMPWTKSLMFNLGTLINAVMYIDFKNLIDQKGRIYNNNNYKTKLNVMWNIKTLINIITLYKLCIKKV